MKLTRYIAILVAIPTMFLAAPASAADFIFALTGSSSARFVLPSMPTPDHPEPDVGFYIDAVDGTVDGAPDTLDLYFANELDGGGFSINSAFILTLGEQLYTGTENTPTFKTGTFALTELGGPGRYSLTITAVPEPATWAMMICGFGLVGGTIRQRRSRQ